MLAAEDRQFFSHNGVDYFSIPRVIGKVRVSAWRTRLATQCAVTFSLTVLRNEWEEGTMPVPHRSAKMRVTSAPKKNT